MLRLRLAGSSAEALGIELSSTHEVTAIYDDGEAARDGRLQVGDRLLRIDGVSLEEATVESLLSAGAPDSSDVVPHILTADACDRPWGSQFFDRILLDAPCTGLGALRRRPESRWRRNRKDVSDLASLQRRLLATGLSSVRSGGVLAYVTCSPHIAETIDVVEEVLLHIDDVQILDAREFLPNVPDLGPGPHVQLWPHLHGTDAMHLTLMRRD